MTSRNSARTSGAFALVELIVVVVILAVLVSLLALASSDSRRRAQLAGSTENLRQFGLGYQSYAKDYADRVATFSWRAGTDYGFGGVAPNDLQAAANQAVDIIRRRGNRSELTPITAWVPNIFYNHLVLVDYLEQELPAKWVVSPGDVVRLAWQRDPENFDELPLTARPAGSGNDVQRWPYSSSYELPAAFYSPNQAEGNQQTVSQAQTHSQYQTPAGNGWMGNRTMSEVAFPAQKAMTYETVQRFFGPRQTYFTYTESRVPVLTADGSVSVRTTAYTNQGFQPNSPTSSLPSRFAYAPTLSWEPPTLSGNAQEFVTGYMRWTRRGLAGRDFDGPEVP